MKLENSATVLQASRLWKFYKHTDKKGKYGVKVMVENQTRSEKLTYIAISIAHDVQIDINQRDNIYSQRSENQNKSNKISINRDFNLK